MVKTPPCSKYEPPKNILYSRNGKKFCRISREANINGPQIPPCDQYGDDYILYTKNDKKFCRKSTKKNSKKINEKHQKSKKISDDKRCLNISENKLKKFAKILNINISKYSDKEWICNNLRELYNTSIPEIKDIQYLSQIFKIKTKDKKESTLCKEIKEESLKNKDFKEIVSIILKQNLESKETDYVVVNILLSSLYPTKFPHDSPIPISETLYQDLIRKKISNEYLTSDEKGLLNNSMYIKLCHCTKKLFLRSKFIKNILNKKDELNNYAVCTRSIYNNRNMKAPPSAVRNCSANFKWIKNTDYIKKQSGGSKCNITSHIGPVPPNKEIIKNNTTTSCFNSFNKHNPPNWPNIYSCPSKRCNYWAGGKKSMKKKGGRISKCNLNNNVVNEITNQSMQDYAKPSNAGKYNQLDYTEKIAKNFDNNNPGWNNWMKKHDNYWW